MVRVGKKKKNEEKINIELLGADRVTEILLGYKRRNN